MSAPAAFLAVCGHTNLDIQLRVQELPTAGSSSPVLDRRTVRGGTAANVARHAGALGVPTRLWSRVGDDFPGDWRDAFESDGTDLSFMDFVRGGRTPTCYVLTDLVDEQAYCMDQGPMANMADHPPDERLIAGLTGWLHLCTGDPRAYLGLAAHAEHLGLGVALDPGQELAYMYDARIFERLLEHANMLFVNRHELDVALKMMNYGDPVQLLDHVDGVVVTEGANGATLYRDEGRPVHVDAFPVDRVVDPTGAGDAMRAGWYAALQVGIGQKEALRWGMAAASVIVQHAGPQDHVVTPRDMQRLLRD